MNQEPYSFASDAWSLGVTIYEAAMLSPPFRGSNICQVTGSVTGSVLTRLMFQCFSGGCRVVCVMLFQGFGHIHYVIYD